MNRTYKIVAGKEDPVLQLQLPTNILKDLAVRSEENGHSIELEIAIRLARSLERDREMCANDDALAQAAFEKIEAYLKK
jgi:hypothetical protein